MPPLLFRLDIGLSSVWCWLSSAAIINFQICKVLDDRWQHQQNQDSSLLEGTQEFWLHYINASLLFFSIFTYALSWCKLWTTLTTDVMTGHTSAQKNFASPSLLMVLASHSWTAITDCMTVPSPSEQKICQLILNHTRLFPSRNTSADNTCLAGPERHLGQHASFHLYPFISEHPFNMWTGAAQVTSLGNGTLMGHSLRLDLLTTWAVPMHNLHLLPALSVKPRQN